jgi:hypothetical protein
MWIRWRWSFLYFSSNYICVFPDISTLAKPFARGLCFEAVLATARVAYAINYGDHVSTFTGGPLVCNASLVKACCGMYWTRWTKLSGSGLKLGLSRKAAQDTSSRAHREECMAPQVPWSPSTVLTIFHTLQTLWTWSANRFTRCWLDFFKPRLGFTRPSCLHIKFEVVPVLVKVPVWATYWGLNPAFLGVSEMADPYAGRGGVVLTLAALGGCVAALWALDMVRSGLENRVQSQRMEDLDFALYLLGELKEVLF